MRKINSRRAHAEAQRRKERKGKIKILYSFPCMQVTGSIKLCALSVMIMLTWVFSATLFAVDVGLVLDQNAIVSGTEGGAGFGYNGIFIPRITGLIGDAGDFYISGGFNYKSDPWSLVPELLRTDFSWRTGSMDFTVGRMAYDDPLGYVASGLFDGARFSQYTKIGTFSAGAWYTGLLYKERAKIGMTDNEYTANKTDIDWNDFSNTYYAPRRFLAAVDWAYKGFLDNAIAKLSLLSQFDLSDEKLHSQYLVGKTIIPVETKVSNGAFSLDLGGSLELIEANNKTSPAFAVEAAPAWRNDVHYVSLGIKYASGKSDGMAAFLPLTNNAQGQIWKPKLSGITMLSIDYTFRLFETLSVGFYPAYYILNGAGSNGRNGGEIFGAAYWSPSPDIGVNLGAGASFGNVVSDEKASWRVALNVVLSLF
jgi:hypothetical protein